MKSLIFIFFIFNQTFPAAQTVRNTSYITQAGEKVLRIEFTLPVNTREAWKLFTTDSGLIKWISPLAHIELKTGGFIITNYNPSGSLADSSSIKLPLINYLEEEMLTLKVNLNDHFPRSVREEDTNLQEIIRFVGLNPNETKIVSSMIGWGEGEAWQKTYAFFELGNSYTYEVLMKTFEKQVREKPQIR